jgi:hypothetical protein
MSLPTHLTILIIYEDDTIARVLTRVLGPHPTLVSPAANSHITLYPLQGW